MAKSVFSLRQQTGRRGHYCSITFNVEEIPSEDKRLIIEYYGDPRWETVCRCGAHLFFEYYSTSQPTCLIVKFMEVEWMPVDRKSIAVLYVTIKGLSENLRITIPDLYFDSVKQSYLIPDPRVVLFGLDVVDPNQDVNNLEK